MQKVLYILAIVALLTSCKDELEVVSSVAEQGIEIQSVNAEIGSEMLTRAPQPTKNVDYIGRDKFVANDVMVLTTVQRTTKPLVNFSYKNVHYTSNANRAWNRDTELDGFDKHERIFWSDNKNGHTFIGYSAPQTWEMATKWTKAGDGSYSGQFSYAEVDGKKIVDFSAIESDFVDEKVKNSNGVWVSTGNRVDSIGTYLKNEDLLLTYNTDQKADATGLNTTIYYRHALASLRVIVDIQGFSPSSTAEDTKTKVSNLVVKNQPWKYQWTQAPQDAVHGIAIPGWGVGNITSADDGTVDIKTWQPRPAGEGTGQAKKYTFYSLIVPGKQSNLTLDFKVTYPKYLNPAETLDKNYRTIIPNIDFLPGYTTTILLSLNHDGEPVYIGAEYIDWENVEIPDNSELQKISIFLDVTERMDGGKTIVSIAKDDVATKDDATWLYYLNGDKSNEDNVRDIYGHTGTPTDPFIIKTARQLLSFAYEVKNGRLFAGRYIKLDSDIYLQKTTDGTDIIWPGVGDATHAFEGVFLGDSRYIKGLNGQPFFNVIGDYAVVDKVNFSKAINVVGAGLVANVNKGLIAGCNVEGNVTQTNPGSGESYCGSIVGDNQSFIVACTHVGDVAGYGYVGGLVGRNAGALVASYHAGLVAYGAGATTDQKKGIGGSTGLKDTKNSIVFSCYQNGDLIAHDPNLLKYRAAWPLTTLQMQSEDFVNSDSDNIFNVEDAHPAVTDPNDNTYVVYIEGADKHYSLNKALQKFSLWVKEKADSGENIELPCHSFSAAQVQTLNALFSKNADGTLVPAHLYRYSPGTYPRIQ